MREDVYFRTTSKTGKDTKKVIMMMMVDDDDDDNNNKQNNLWYTHVYSRVRTCSEYYGCIVLCVSDSAIFLK